VDDNSVIAVVMTWLPALDQDLFVGVNIWTLSKIYGSNSASDGILTTAFQLINLRTRQLTKRGIK
jgi:hypothetical protein